MADGGRIGKILDKIPGYGGYRDKERRRESDRRLREELANDYEQLANRLGNLASRLAEDRKIMAIRHVDKPHQKLVFFIDRLRTATYGYGPLFSDDRVDEQALDQLAAFDQSLKDQYKPLEEQIATMESADPMSPEFKNLSDQAAAIIQRLHDRFDRRREVIETGQAMQAIDLSALLTDPSQQAATPTAYGLHQGEAVTRADINYTVTGRITIETDKGSWRVFQLRGGDNRTWLHVPATATNAFLWLNEVDISGSPGESELAVDSESYQLVDSADGTGEIIGRGGSARDRNVSYYQYQTPSGHGILIVYDWNGEHTALAGEVIDPAELEIWSREGGQAV